MSLRIEMAHELVNARAALNALSRLVDEAGDLINILEAAGLADESRSYGQLTRYENRIAELEERIAIFEAADYEALRDNDAPRARIAALEEALRHQFVVHGGAASGCTECDKGAALVVSSANTASEAENVK